MVSPSSITDLTPLAAGWIEAGWLDGLGPLLVVAFWVIRQVMVAISEQRENEKAKREGRHEIDEDEAFDLDQEPALAGVPDAPEKPEPAQGELRSEVEDFLRRIGEMPADPPKAEKHEGVRQLDLADEPDDPPPRRQPIDPFEEPPHRQRRSRPAAEARPMPTPAVELLIEPEKLQQQEPVQRSRQELRHLPESQLAEQAAHLGEGIASADDRLEARLHDKFDHRLGKLRRAEAKPEEEEKPALGSASDLAGASRIKDLLSRPGGVREAVVLSEILRRPGDQL